MEYQGKQGCDKNEWRTTTFWLIKVVEPVEIILDGL
jgi:hypothetical protein